MLTSISGPSISACCTPAWSPAGLAEDQGWQVTLSDTHHAELRAALAAFKATWETRYPGVPLAPRRFPPSAVEFRLPSLSGVLARAQRQLEEQQGVFLLRGFPTEQPEEDRELMYGGLLAHIGQPQPQTINGERLQPVRDEGQAELDERRGSKHNLGLPVHNDGCDVVGFLCVATPAEGGTTILVNAAAVHDALLRDHPDDLAVLYQPFHNAWQDYMFPGGRNSATTDLPRTWAAPVFSKRDGCLCCRYSRFYTDRAQSFADVPAMTDAQLAALDRLDTYINDERWQFRRQFEVGDVLLLNNHVTLHSRTAFTDTGNQRRELSRAWLAVPNSRPLASFMRCFFGNVEAGAPRGGVKSEFLRPGAIAISPAE